MKLKHTTLLLSSLLLLSSCKNETQQEEATKEPKQLEVVGQFDTRPGNVAVAKDGRVFTTMHLLGKSKVQLVEVKGTQEFEVFPSMEYQKNGAEASLEKLDTPLGIRIDENNVLWIIDIGQNLGTTRLFAFDIATKEEVYRLDLPEEMAPEGSFIQDLAVDESNGWVYLADFTNPGIIAIHTEDNSVRRFGHPSMNFEDIDMVINEQVVNFGGAPARVAINPITLSDDRETLYYGAMNGTNWYQIPAKLLRDGASDEVLSEAIEITGKKPISDGVATHQGKHYFTNLPDSGIDVLTENGELLPVIRDAKIDWADNVAIHDGYAYIVVNQLHKTPAFTEGEDLGKPPYFIYKYKLE